MGHLMTKGHKAVRTLYDALCRIIVRSVVWLRIRGRKKDRRKSGRASKTAAQKISGQKTSGQKTAASTLTS